ncbi:hypothetical protein AKJ51_04040 [candidate division MSBL1 archaeon SCGC-AAA382A20]|uniref:Uncharacterized protein n=1 Tax=candidate division MSBL1 archaeon SCGC-AAA382A20 TaxID=1698280 RepID=A0A133VIE5_9EURY|nr:hypothetical protein AKJ51_04040 [candidate division MSBL1 archaeon SCGC-AAA382A20]
MKMKLEIPFIICMKRNTKSNRIPSKKEIVEYFEKQITNLEDKIEHSDTDELIKKYKESLPSKKESLKKVNEIDDWEGFCKKVIEGDYIVYDGGKR